MNSRRIAELAPLALIFLFLVLCMFLIVFACNAQTFRADNQIRLLSAIHITSPWSTWASEARITNHSRDPVSISITYGAANGAPNPVTFRDVIKLEPWQECEFVDFLGAAASSSPQCKLIGAPLPTSGFGQLVFNGCLDGADCRWDHVNAAGQYDPPPEITRNYRNISVESRIYSFTTAGGPTVGQNLAGVPWWSYGDAANPLTIRGIRNLQDVWHTNIGLVNASDTRPATVIVTLYDGVSHAQRDQVMVTLPPFGARQQGATELFPLLGEWSRLNRTRAATNAYITVAAAGVDDRFFAYGSMIDSRSGDPTMLEATFDRVLNGDQVTALFGPPIPSELCTRLPLLEGCGGGIVPGGDVMAPNPPCSLFPESCRGLGPQGLRAAAKGVLGVSEPPCRVVGPLSTHGDYVFEKPDPMGTIDPLTGKVQWLINSHLGVNEVDKAKWLCGQLPVRGGSEQK